MRYDSQQVIQQGYWQSWGWTHSLIPLFCSIPDCTSTGMHCLSSPTSLKPWPSCCYSTTWPLPGIQDVFMTTSKAKAERCANNPTLWWGIVVRVCVALAAVLHQEAGVVPGHAKDAIWLVKEHVGQHSAMAVHDDNLTISGAKQNLKITEQPPAPSEVSDRTPLWMHLAINLLFWKWIKTTAVRGLNRCHNRTLQPIKDVHEWRLSSKI